VLSAAVPQQAFFSETEAPDDVAGGRFLRAVVGVALGMAGGCARCDATTGSWVTGEEGRLLSP
jgi:hypothetical protein